jgi:penicillin-binding protein 1A
MTKRATQANALPRAASRQRSRRAVRRSSFKRRFKTFLAVAFLLVETVVAALLACGYFIFQRLSHTMPKVDQLVVDVRPPVATTIWSQDGVLLGKLDVENRQPITLDDMPKAMLDATVAIEDHRFYEHRGVDLQGIARAAFANFSGNRATRQGGSTLTQQLVRNIDAFGLTKEKRYERKVREALIALRVEQVYTKREILALYLNNIYYGGGAYGVQAAAKTYFGKSAYKLDISEAALLAGLPQRPSAFSPFEHRTAALKRRDEVIDSMARYGYITPEQASDAKLEQLKFMPQQKKKDFNFKAPYFVWYVLNDLFRRYGSSYVYSGLKIETTLSWKLQKEAEAQLEHGLQTQEHGGNQGALIAIDNATGYIRAMVGGRDFHANQYNNVTQGHRQPGSTFKLFDYTAAFNEGKCGLYDTFEDRPIPYPNDPKKVVKNFGGGYRYAPVTCLNAIEQSINTVAVQAASTVGIKTVIDYAHKMGITNELVPVLPTALGASPVRPLDLCSAYSLIADKGVRFHPMSLVRVIDGEGSMVEENVPKSEENFLKPTTIQQIDQALEGVVTSGSGTRARGNEGNGIVEGAHGKTGTTTDSRDAWFAGYTPELTAVIWMASVHRDKHGGLRYEPMESATGGVVCAPIWHDFMIKALPEERQFRQAWERALNPSSPQAQAVLISTETPPPPKRPKSKTVKPPTTPPGTIPAAGVNNPATLPANPADPNHPSAVDATGAPLPGGSQPGADGTAPTQPDASGGTTGLAPGAARTVTPPVVSPPKSAPVVSAPRSAPPTMALNASGAGASTARPDPVVRPAPPTRTVTPTRPVVPPKTEAPEMVEVSVCVDSGRKATDWCPATKTVRMTKQQAARLGRCRTHHPPPGE